MHQKSMTCLGKTSQLPLNEYTSQEAAQEHANYLRNGSAPYKCKNCKKWHLAPRSRITPSKTCTCLDSRNTPKELYLQKNLAERRAEIIKKEQGVVISTYKCPLGKGWHLTKKKFKL